MIFFAIALTFGNDFFLIANKLQLLTWMV